MGITWGSIRKYGSTKVFLIIFGDIAKRCYYDG